MVDAQLARLSGEFIGCTELVPYRLFWVVLQEMKGVGDMRDFGNLVFPSSNGYTLVGDSVSGCSMISIDFGWFSVYSAYSYTDDRNRPKSIEIIEDLEILRLTNFIHVICCVWMMGFHHQMGMGVWLTVKSPGEYGVIMWYFNKDVCEFSDSV